MINERIGMKSVEGEGVVSSDRLKSLPWEYATNTVRMVGTLRKETDGPVHTSVRDEKSRSGLFVVEVKKTLDFLCCRLANDFLEFGS